MFQKLTGWKWGTMRMRKRPLNVSVHQQVMWVVVAIDCHLRVQFKVVTWGSSVTTASGGHLMLWSVFTGQPEGTVVVRRGNWVSLLRRRHFAHRDSLHGRRQEILHVRILILQRTLWTGTSVVRGWIGHLESDFVMAFFWQILSVCSCLSSAVQPWSLPVKNADSIPFGNEKVSRTTRIHCDRRCATQIEKKSLTFANTRAQWEGLIIRLRLRRWRWW